MEQTYSLKKGWAWLVSTFMEQTLEDAKAISKLSEISFNFRRNAYLYSQELPVEKEHGKPGLGRQKQTGKE